MLETSFAPLRLPERTQTAGRDTNTYAQPGFIPRLFAGVLPWLRGAMRRR